MIMIQVRHVPDQTHRKLKSRAALEGLSLSDYLLRELENLVEKPTMEEMEQRLASRALVSLSEDPTETIRRLRDSR